MQTSQNPLMEIALRIREMREIMGLTEAEMAEKTQVLSLIHIEMCIRDRPWRGRRRPWRRSRCPKDRKDSIACPGF